MSPWTSRQMQCKSRRSSRFKFTHGARAGYAVCVMRGMPEGIFGLLCLGIQEILVIYLIHIHRVLLYFFSVCVCAWIIHVAFLAVPVTAATCAQGKWVCGGVVACFRRTKHRAGFRTNYFLIHCEHWISWITIIFNAQKYNRIMNHELQIETHTKHK